VAIVTSNAEHSSVARPLADLAARGASVATVPIQRDGQLDLGKLAEAVSPATDLVSVHWVQNETGVVQELAAVRRLLADRAPQALLHVDAVQGAAKLPLPWREARLDLVSIAGHKLHGPPGVGALLVRRGAEPTPLLLGGGQQDGLRSGSLDAIGIQQLALAVMYLAARQAELAGAIGALNRALRDGLARLTDRHGRPVRLRIVSPEQASPWIVSFALPGYQGAVLARALGEHDVLVGTGSACASETNQPSPVLLAMGLSRDEAFGALRVSFGTQNTPDDVTRCLAALQAVLRAY
jgi:cysteine desulfurase